MTIYYTFSIGSSFWLVNGLPGHAMFPTEVWLCLKQLYHSLIWVLSMTHHQRPAEFSGWYELEYHQAFHKTWCNISARCLQSSCLQTKIWQTHTSCLHFGHNCWEFTWPTGSKIFMHVQEGWYHLPSNKFWPCGISFIGKIIKLDTLNALCTYAHHHILVCIHICICKYTHAVTKTYTITFLYMHSHVQTHKKQWCWVYY